jgi:hypothetical protein
MKRLLLAAGTFLVVACAYVITGPGRIDIIDGQYRFDVAHNLLAHHTDQVSDRALIGALISNDGRRFSPYSVTSSAVSLPLIWLARHLGPESIDREQFYFSFTSAFFAAGTAVLLLIFFGELGLSDGEALLWVFVVAFATSMLPAGTTVFDQAQHAFFLTGGALLLFKATQADSIILTIAAGLMLAFAVTLKEIYLVHLATLSLITLPQRHSNAEDRRRGYVRAATFVGVGSTGLLWTAANNYLHFGDVTASVRASGIYINPIGNPYLGVAALLISPGKGILFYSPIVLLSIWGLRQLEQRHSRLAQAVVVTSIVHLVGMGSLSFFGGDWCWGPRYLVPTIPLLTLALPFAGSRSRRRPWLWTLISMSFAVQLMGISIDAHRFFYARSLPPFFWYGNGGFYFRNSALSARVLEIRDSLRNGIPPEARAFRPGPYPTLLTYTTFGPVEASTPMWMRNYRLFWLPRPWPFWMADLNPGQRPIGVRVYLIVLLSVATSGVLAIRYGLRRTEAPSAFALIQSGV